MKSCYLLSIIFFTGIVFSFSQERETPSELMKRGIQNMNEKDFYEAIEAFTLIIQQDSASKFAYIYRGFARNSIKAYKEAIEDFDKAIQIDPKYLKNYVDRAKIKLNLNDTLGAINDLEVISNNNPDADVATAAFIILSKLYYQTHNYKMAVYAYTKLIEKDPNDAQSWFSRGLCKDKLKHYDEAIKDYTACIKLSPDLSEAYGNRGVAKMNLINDSDRKIEKKKEFIQSACNDLKRAQKFGNDEIKKMLDCYCKD